MAAVASLHTDHYLMRNTKALVFAWPCGCHEFAGSDAGVAANLEQPRADSMPHLPLHARNRGIAAEVYRRWFQHLARTHFAMYVTATVHHLPRARNRVINTKAEVI